MAGNLSIPDLTVVPDPVGGDLYIAKDNQNYRVAAGGSGGLATLGSDGKLLSTQVPAASVTVTWASVSGKPTTVSGYGITDAVTTPNFTWTNLAGKPTTFAPAAHSAALLTSGLVPSARLTGSYTDFVDAEGSGVSRFSAFSAQTAGTLANPAFRFGSDPNTGIYNPSGDVLSIVAGGTARGAFSGTGLAVTGAITATGNITGYSSDKRLKTNITNITNPMDKLFRIGGYTFNWDLKKCSDIGFMPYKASEHGVIAQEVQKVMPDAVHPAAFDPTYLTVDYARIVPLLIECIKELNNRLDRLEIKE